ncbi:MAG: DUF2252 domain-containing protein [Acidimicrobiia bacterium]|nr:MAG: DUF2252 domain-containing protein [Acidimicrobiia bacterium]
MKSIAERLTAGKALRRDTPRSAHARVDRSASLDPVDLVLSQERGRIESLIPIRRERMAESAFAFFRAGAQLMAKDLASTPRTGILVQASGDAHVSNFGWYGSPERALVFDTNDFDETLKAAWEWDVKRLATSFVIVCRDNGFSAKRQGKAALSAVEAYQKAMGDFASRPVLDVWYAQISADDVLERLDDEGRTRDVHKAEKEFRKASRKDSRHVLGKLAERSDGRYRIKDDPPFVVSVRSMGFPLDPDRIRELVDESLDRYLETVSPAIRTLIQGFDVVDLALKVVGVGSVGTRTFIVMLEGNGPEDVLFLQLKEAGRSVLEDEFGDSGLDHAGQRVVEGQRLMQTTSDILLGWTTSSGGTQYYVRQLKDMKASANLAKLDPDDMTTYARTCGAVLAAAHARSGDPAIIAGYLGTNSSFARAVAKFASVYADQNEQDYQAFLERVRVGP